MTSATEQGAIPIVRSVRELAACADAWFVDIWGVMHNGVSPFVSAVDACQKFRASGGTVVLVSNSPRPAQGVAAQLDEIGVRYDAWDHIVSSGDATRHHIAAWGDRAVFHLGPKRDERIFDGLSAQRVDAADAAGVVCSGLFDDTRETPDDYHRMLADFAARQLPMICANPDLQVERGGQIIYCAGALAQAYEAMGGGVVYAGKPYAPIYKMAFGEVARLRGAPVLKSRVLAIGDGVKTDIAGAFNVGIPAVYVASAIHMGRDRALDENILCKLFPDPSRRPVAAMSALAW